MIRWAALLLSLAALSCAPQRLRIDFSCVGTPTPAGLLVMNCADAESWKDFIAKQGKDE